MCFSATASFTAAALLTVIGIRSLMITTREQRFYATIPLLFGMQQAAEGVVWLTQQGIVTAYAYITSKIFLIFALAVWPAIVPIAVHSMEANRTRKIILKVLESIGLVFSLTALDHLRTFTVSIINGSLVYQPTIPDVYASLTPFINKFALLIYLVPTILPWFISSHRLLHWFGIIILGALGLTYAFWAYALTSVWCFFAAILSTFIWASLEFKLLQKSAQ